MVVPVQLVQMDDCNWGSDVSEFNPYRFLSKSGKKSHIVLNTSFSGLNVLINLYFLHNVLKKVHSSVDVA